MISQQTPMDDEKKFWGSLKYFFCSCFISRQQQEKKPSIQKKSTACQQNQKLQQPPIAITIKLPIRNQQIETNKNHRSVNHIECNSVNKADINMKVRKRGLRGMINLGNSCYMNSATQCLLNLKRFNQNLQNLLLGECQLTDRYISRHKLTHQYLNLLTQLYIESNDNRKQDQYQFSQPLDLTKFKHLIETINPIFKGHNQHDAHQLLITILEGINKEISRVQKQPQYKKLPNTLNHQHNNVYQLSQHWWHYQKLKSDSIVYDTFHAQNLSVIKCKTCNLNTFSFNTLLSLQISILTNSKSEIFTLQDLINQEFRSTKIIQGYYCNNCKAFTTCQDQNWMFILPEVMILHLKRFQERDNGIQKNASAIKMSDHLNFNQVLHPESHSKNRCQYILTSVIHHTGNLKFGHYTASVYKQQEEKWYLINDRYVSSSVMEEYTESAFLLFYERI